MLKRSNVPLPDWDDEDGVARLGGEIIDAFERRWRAYEEAGTWEINTAKEGTLEDLVNRFTHAEQSAVDAAMRGDVAPLATLLQDENWHWMEPKTRQLIARILTGVDPKTGEPKRRGSGRRKMAAEDRMATNPIHVAERDVRLIEARLQRLYPAVRRAVVRTRAIAIVAARTGIAIPALRKHVERSRNDPHRLSHH